MAERVRRDDPTTRTLKWIAFGLAGLFVGWAVYDRFVTGVVPGDMAYHAGSQAFEDGAYERAITEFRSALEAAPDHIFALRGLAISLHQAGRHEAALADYERALATNPEVAEGPHWLTRFLRKQAEAPPTVADLAKPEAQRVLRMPELDAQQRPYQQ